MPLTPIFSDSPVTTAHFSTLLKHPMAPPSSSPFLHTPMERPQGHSLNFLFANLHTDVLLYPPSTLLLEDSRCPMLCRRPSLPAFTATSHSPYHLESHHFSPATTIVSHLDHHNCLLPGLTAAALTLPLPHIFLHTAAREIP